VGRNGRERRRDKQRRQARKAGRAAGSGRVDSGRVDGPAGPRRVDADGLGRLNRATAEELLHIAAWAAPANDDDQEVAAGLLVEDARVPSTVVPAVVSDTLLRVVRGLWSGGWQPADLPRLAVRDRGRRHGRLAVAVIAADATRYRDHPDADPRWLAQLQDMGAGPGTGERDGNGNGNGATVLAGWAGGEGLAIGDGVAVAVELLALLWRLPKATQLMDPPDRWGKAGRRVRRAPDGMDHKVLDRVRGLLAKAESTTFAAEAEALTAKAQQLMDRHALDRAMVDGAGGGESEPEGRRIAVDDPYAVAKAMLLAQVAGAGRCRVVWDGEHGFSTVFGYPSDLEMVETLYTSLLVQGTTTMVAAGADQANRRARSRSFRQSFLVAYARRIGQRLEETDRATVAEAAAAHGAALLPVLASRLDTVDDAVNQAFPSVTSVGLSANDAGGWVAGTLAADQAHIGMGPGLDTAEPG